MKPLEDDKKLSQAIKTYRLIKGVKQINVAEALKIGQGTYSKIEKGELAISYGQLKIIAKEINTSHFHIIYMANEENNTTVKLTSLSETMNELFKKFEETKETNLTEEEFESLISNIRRVFKRAEKKTI